MSGPNTRIAIDAATLQNIRVVWPPKDATSPLPETDDALRALHRIRRQIQVYDGENKRGSRRVQLGIAGLTAAMAITGLPLVSILGSGTSEAASDPGIQLSAAAHAPPTAPDYSLAAPIDSEGLFVERPEIRSPQEAAFHQALVRVAGSTAAPDAEAPAPPQQDTSTNTAAQGPIAPALAEISAAVSAELRPNPAFNSQRHEASTYVSPPAPPPRRAATPVYRGYIQDLIYRYFPASQAAFATRVAFCESGFNPNAVGDQGRARGIFQFWQATFLETRVGAANGWDAAFNAEVNVRAAAEKVARDGWRAWTCARKV